MSADNPTYAEYLRCAVLFNGREYSTWDTPEEAYAWLARTVDRIARRPNQSAADDFRILPIGRFSSDSQGCPVTDGRHVY